MIISLLVLALTAATTAQAQIPDTAWSYPFLLTPENDVCRIRPLMTTDSSGRIHAIWHEARDASSTCAVDAVFYSMWDGEIWSQATDIIAAPMSGDMSLARSFITTNDGLLVIAWSANGNVILSKAPIQTASTAHAWTLTSVGGGTEPTLAIAADGRIWALSYWRNPSELAVSLSYDQGDTWTKHLLIWTADKESAGTNVEGLFVKDGRLQLLWTETTLRRVWSGEAIWHATVDPHTEVIEVREVARSVSLDEPTIDGATMAECPNGELHILWNNGVASRTGRFHQWWLPDDLIWSAVEPVFPGLSGQTSKAGLVCDGVGRMHLVTAADSVGASGTYLRYATWFNGIWSDYATLWQGEYPGERPWLTIVGGNHLHLLWHVFPTSGDVPGDFIAHAQRLVAAEPIQEEALLSEFHVTGASATIAESELPTVPSATEMTASITGRPVAIPPVQDTDTLATAKPLLLAAIAPLPILALFLWKTRRRGDK